jgi:putative protease
VIVRDELANVASAQSTMPLAAAEKQPLTEERLREQLGRLGGTPFVMGGLINRIEGNVVLPISELNKVRRELVSQIEAQRSRPKRWQLSEPSGISTIQLSETPENAPAKTDAAELIVLVRSLPQLQAALECGSKIIYCEFEDPKKYREAVSAVRIATNCSERAVEIWVAPPRIFKTGEEWILKIVRSSGADGYLVRNYDHLKYFRDCRKIGDFSLNIANQLSAEYFRNQFQLERLTASYDLNAIQLEALLSAAPASWFEITLHQHMPMFHMEHCVFCAFLSKGTDYRNCGRPCDAHEVKLRDRVGAEHPLKADAGCRNTVFNSRAQTGAEYFERFYGMGTRHFRIEFLNESPETVHQTIAHYRKLLRREISGSDLWRELNLQNQLGVTRGQIGQEEKHFSARG